VTPVRRARIVAGPIRVDAALLRRWPLPQPAGDVDKEVRGRVLVVGGSREIPGAVRLAGEAALRAGAGKLQIATARGAGIAMGIAVPEARVFELPTDPDGELRGPGRQLGPAAADADAVLIGPGMAAEARTSRLVATMAPRCRALVLDAGAIAALASAPGARAVRRAGTCVITPHFGEMATLLDVDIGAIHAYPQGVAVAVAREHGCVVVLKSATTWIADAEGGLWRHDDGPVGLATSGSGDVLAGVVVGLLARGAKPTQAAAWAVALHAAAGRTLSRTHGDTGFLARDIAGAIAAK
jgi:ADP-dependent NAD(P)H-hydrate dehydratase